MPTKEKMKPELHKGFVWYSVRTLYWVIIVLLLYNWIFVKNEGLSSVIGIIWVILAIPLFILAIIHLNIYKKDGRGDAITALIISGIALGIFLFGLANATTTIPPTQTRAQTSLYVNQITTPDSSNNCQTGYVLGNDYLCHQVCVDSKHYCPSETCFNNQCVTCPSGSMVGLDGHCYPPCVTSNTYCATGTCYNNQCVTCPLGYVLRTDGNCYPSQ